MTAGPVYDLAIIGGGFCGTTLLHRLSSALPAPFSIALIDDNEYDGVGPAYATPDALHRLNVPAGKMGALAENPAGFIEWMQANWHKNAHVYDFVSRGLYGAYLRTLKQAALARMAAGNLQADMVAARATAITRHDNGYRITTTAGTITARMAVLATGNSFARAPVSPRHITQPWFFNFGNLPDNSGDIAILGTGLSAVDTMLSLRARTGQNIICVSRRGRFPMPHPLHEPPVPPPAPPLPTQARLSKLMHLMRGHVEKFPELPWQSAFDSFRPHHTQMWNALPVQDKIRFLRRYFSLWNSYRHRMADDIANTIKQARASGQIRLVEGGVAELQDNGNGIRITFQDGTVHDAAIVFDCRGPAYGGDHVGLVRALAEDGTVTLHPAGYGLQSHDRQRVSAADAPPLYALGSWLVGERLESTAVPELRAQVKILADQISTDYRT